MTSNKKRKLYLFLVLLIISIVWFGNKYGYNERIDYIQLRDATEKFNAAKATGNKYEMYIQAQRCALVYAIANDEKNYNKWKVIEHELENQQTTKH